MQETEKRTGVTLEDARRLKSAIDDRYTRKSVVNRTVVVKVDNDDFSPNPDTLVDIKTKLIDVPLLRRSAIVSEYKRGAVDLVCIPPTRLLYSGVTQSVLREQVARAGSATALTETLMLNRNPNA